MSAQNASYSPLVAFPTSFSEYTPLSLVVSGLAAVIFSVLLLRSNSNGDVYELGGIPIITAWPFFTKRYDFIQAKFKESEGRMFRFKVLQHRVLALRGEQSRKEFFNGGGLNLSEGYRILMGGSPELKDVQFDSPDEVQESQSEVDDVFVKRVVSLVRKDKIGDMIPALLHDINRRMLDWGGEGRINPFKEVNDLVMQMTVRMATCRELAEDRNAIENLTEHYWTIERCATPVALLLPWFSGADKKAKEKSTTALYSLLLDFVQRRRKDSERTSDAIDLFIEQGDSDHTIVGTIIGIVFTAVINTGLDSCWSLIYLGSNPTWKQRAIDEYKALLSNNVKDDNVTKLPLHKLLTMIPLNAWEDELPSVDLVIRETLRLTLVGSAIRRNLRRDMVVDGVTVKRGDFLTYQIGDAHMNPRIYTEPEKFDPDRYLEGREEDRKEALAYLGWGAGRHPCAGMRIAKLEIKLILAMVLLGFEYEVVDGSGTFPKTVPQPDKNDLQLVRSIPYDYWSITIFSIVSLPSILGTASRRTLLSAV